MTDRDADFSYLDRLSAADILVVAKHVA